MKPTEKQLQLLKVLLKNKIINYNQYNSAKDNKKFASILIGENSKFLNLKTEL